MTVKGYWMTMIGTAIFAYVAAFAIVASHPPASQGAGVVACLLLGTLFAFGGLSIVHFVVPLLPNSSGGPVPPTGKIAVTLWGPGLTKFGPSNNARLLTTRVPAVELQSFWLNDAEMTMTIKRGSRVLTLEAVTRPDDEPDEDAEDNRRLRLRFSIGGKLYHNFESSDGGQFEAYDDGTVIVRFYLQDQGAGSQRASIVFYGTNNAMVPVFDPVSAKVKEKLPVYEQ